MSVETLVARALAPFRRRLDNLVMRAVVALVDDAKLLQSLQVTTLDTVVRDGAERFQQYGFTAVPLEGAEAIALFLGGSHDHPVIIAVDDRRHRLKGLQPGEVALYTDQGDYVIIRRGGAMELKASASVTITSPSVKLTGALEVDGGVTFKAGLEVDGDVDIKGNAAIEGSSGLIVANGDVVAGAIDLKHHTHTGVTSGGSQTGPPL